MTIDLADEPVQGPSDADLIIATRSGDTAAFGQLYARHVDAARRLARTLTQSRSDADDLVAEVFAKLLDKLRDSAGPETAFRTYLLTSVRNAFYDRVRRNQKVTLTDDVAKHAPGVPFVDTAIEGLERSLAARAFARLPERWQMVLWHTEVEGESPAEVAPLMGLTPNGVAALAYRARERLRQAYLQEHLTETASDSCGPIVEKLGTHVRGGLSNRDSGRVQAHLSDCSRCRALFTDLREVNSGLRGILAPLVLGGSAAAYVTAGGKTVFGLASFLGGARKVASTWTAQAAIGGAGIAVATAVAITVTPHVTNAPTDTIVAPAPTSSTGGSASLTPKGSQATPSTSVSPGATGIPGQPGVGVPSTTGPTTSPTAAAPGGSDPGDGTDSPGEPGDLEDEPGKTTVALDFDPAKPMARGSTSTLVLTLTNTGRADGEVKKNGKGPVTSKITGELTLPAGVTLAGTAAGDGWKCAAVSTGAVCRHPSIATGATTTARIPVTVAADAASGAPRMVITSNKIGSRTIQCSGGVVS